MDKYFVIWVKTNTISYNIIGVTEDVVKQFVFDFQNDNVKETFVNGVFYSLENIREIHLLQIEKEEIETIRIKQEYRRFAHNKELIPEQILRTIGKDVNDIFLHNNIIKISMEASKSKQKVFIVHGHNSEMKEAIARFIEKIGLEAIILDEQSNNGNTIIEKIEKHSDANFAIILYSPCDMGRSIDESNLHCRARQNVVWEHGYFVGKLGRKRVCALVKDNSIERPSDISGLLYINYEDRDWQIKLIKEIKASGINVDLNVLQK